eukprot:scaffold64625_cov18-Prasinocladus_malaysianus.AAC.1
MECNCWPPCVVLNIEVCIDVATVAVCPAVGEEGHGQRGPQGHAVDYLAGAAGHRGAHWALQPRSANHVGGSKARPIAFPRVCGPCRPSNVHFCITVVYDNIIESRIAKFGVANDVLDILRAESLSFHEFLEALARVADAIGWPQRQVIGTYRPNYDHNCVSPCTAAGSRHYLKMTNHWQPQNRYNITMCKDIMPIRF